MATGEVRINARLRGNRDVWERGQKELQERINSIHRASKAAGMSTEEAQEAIRLFARSLHETDQLLMPMRGWEWTDQKELL